MNGFQVWGLVVFAVMLTVKEVWNSSGRTKLHERINGLNGKYVRKDVCHASIAGLTIEISHLKKDTTEIKKDVKELLKNVRAK